MMARGEARRVLRSARRGYCARVSGRYEVNGSASSFAPRPPSLRWFRQHAS